MRQDLTPAVSDDADTFDVRASLIRAYLAARHEWRVVVLTCTVVLVMAGAYAIFWPPIYRAQAVLLSEGDTDTARDAFYVAWSVFRKDDIRTELELFVSAPVLKEVIKREKLTYDDVYHPFVSHLAYLWQTSFVGRNYRRLKNWLLGSEEGELSPEEQDRARTLGDMRAGITLDPVGEAHIGNLTVRGPSRRVSDIANRLIEVYLEQRLERYKSEATGAIGSLGEEVKSAESALRQVEEARLKFLQTNRLSFDFDKEKLEVSKLSGLEESIEGNLVKIASSRASLNEIERQLTAQPAMRTINTSYELKPNSTKTQFAPYECHAELH